MFHWVMDTLIVILANVMVNSSTSMADNVISRYKYAIATERQGFYHRSTHKHY